MPVMDGFEFLAVMRARLLRATSTRSLDETTCNPGLRSAALPDTTLALAPYYLAADSSLK